MCSGSARLTACPLGSWLPASIPSPVVSAAARIHAASARWLRTRPRRPAPMEISFSRRTLDNGLDVLVHQDRNCPIVAVNVWYHVGSKNEKPGRTGFAHLFEHL